MYDLIIIGGGISGLHCAYRLQHKYKILILEKEPCLGGRIKTVDFDGHNIEAGAGRLNQTHNLYHSLLHELKVTTVKIPGNVTYIEKGIYYEDDAFVILDSVISASRKMKIETLQQYTFIDYAKTILSNEQISFVKGSFGYYEQLIKMNAYDAIKLFDKGMHTKNHFFIVKNGMSQVIERLQEKLNNTCKIKCNTIVKNIKYNNNIFTIETSQKKKFESHHCICAIPKLAMEKIPFFSDLKPKMKSIGVKILCRIYAKFEKEDIWFDKLPKSTVNNEIRYIIPIDKENGVIMISYTDSIYARYWASLPEYAVIPTLQKKIKEALGIDIPKPKIVKAFYWETGTAYWKPKYDSRTLYDAIQKPYSDIPLYICGENFSQTQGWVEGALESSRDVVERLK